MENNFQREKIFVTGGTGFIGSHICLELIDFFDIIVIDNLSNSQENVIDKIKKISQKDNIIFYQLNLLEKKKIDNIFQKYRPIMVIHLAALKAVNESITDPLRYYNNNLISTLNLLSIMAKYQCYNLIFSSSATVYGNSPIPFSEESQTGIGITNPYGRTKIMIEQIINDLVISDEKWNIIVLRYFNPVGAHPSGLIGESPNDKPNNLMPYILKVAINNNTTFSLGQEYNKLKIFGNDYPTNDGYCVRDFIHVVDLAKGHLMVAKKIKSMKGLNIYNLGTGKGTSVYQLINTFEKVNEVKIPCDLAERRVGDISEFYCNAEKAERELGWKAVLSLEQMCIDSWNYQLKFLDINYSN